MADSKSDVKFMTQTILDLAEYNKYVKAMQGSQLKNIAIAVAACIWLLAAGAYNISKGSTILGIFMIVVGIGAPILVRVGANNQTERDFEKIREAGGANFRVRFYEDRFETQNDTSHGVHEYKKILNVIENDTAFYLEVEKGRSVIIQKKNCSEELITFLRTLQ